MRDLDVRRSLHDLLSIEHGLESDTLVLDELGLANGRGRIDVAVINGELAGYEIKSDRDTLVRLDGQMQLYNRVFDRVWVVVAPRHLEATLSLVPQWWGVHIAEQTDSVVTLRSVRHAEPNPAEQDGVAVAQLLWREEALAMLDEFDVGDAKLRRGSRRHMYVALAQALQMELLKERVRAALKSREGWRS